MKFIVLILGHFDNLQLISLQRYYLQNYQIPYYLIFPQYPDNYQVHSNDRSFTQSTEWSRLVQAIKTLDLTAYDYIVITHLQTYLNIKQLTRYLNQLPDKQVVAGLIEGSVVPSMSYELQTIRDTFVISQDVVTYLNNYTPDDKILAQDNGIYHILHRYVPHFIYQPMLVLYHGPSYGLFIAHVHKYPVIQIAYTDKKTIIDVWNKLLTMIDDMTLG